MQLPDAVTEDQLFEVAVATIVNYMGQFHDAYSGFEDTDKKLDEFLAGEFEQLQPETLYTLIAALGRDRAFQFELKARR
jgi:hypothetical protein